MPTERPPSPIASDASDRPATAGPPLGSPEPLTEEWVAWLAERLSGRRIDSEVDLIVQHRVVDDDGGEFCWHVRLKNGTAQVAAGMADVSGDGPSVVTFTSDPETARAIAVGGASAQQAFVVGRLRLNGDSLLLISARPALAALAEAFDGAS